MTELTRREKWIMKPRDNRERLAAYYMVTVPAIVWMTLWVALQLAPFTAFLVSLAVFFPVQALFAVWYQKRTPAT